MSAQIQIERKQYYECLEKTQKGSLDITSWLMWFLECLNGALSNAEEKLSGVLVKSKFWEVNSHAIWNERQRIMVNKLLDGFEGKLNSSRWAKIAKCSSDTALRDIQGLIDQGILEKEPAGGRSTSYRLVI
jgi:Fic family protein